MKAFDSKASEAPVSIHAKAFPRGVTIERHQFTALDRHVGTNRCVLPWAFLYKETLRPAALKEALSAALDAFPTLAGRVQPEKPASRFARTTNWQLACCNAGVPFSVHSSSSSLQELLQSGAMTQRQGFTFPDAKESTLPPYMERMDAAAVLSGDAPVLAVRLTQLAGGGSILAVTASHVVLDGRSYVRFLQHWAGLYNSLMAGAAAAGEAAAVAPAAAAGSSSSSSSSRVCYAKKVLVDLAAVAVDNSAVVQSAVPPAAAAAAVPPAIKAAAAAPVKLRGINHPQALLPTAPAAAVAVTPLGWSKDAAAFLSNSGSSNSGSSAAPLTAQHSRSVLAAEVPPATGDTSTPSGTAPARDTLAASTASQAAIIDGCPADNGPNINSSSSLMPSPALAAGLTDASGLSGLSGQPGCASLMPSPALAAGLTDVSGLSGQPGCASLSVLPFTDASSTAAEADETASLQPSISVASTTSTVISACFSTGHAGGLKEKPSWHGVVQHAAPISSSSSAVPPPPTSAAPSAVPVSPAAALGEAPAAGITQQRQQQQQQAHEQLPASPSTPPATAAAPATLTSTTPETTPTHASRAPATSNPKSQPFPYTPDPLLPTRILPNSWLDGFKAAAAAVAQVRAEQRHIKQALLQRQGLLPATEASLCGFGGGSRAEQQLIGAAAVTTKDAASTDGGGGGSSSSSSRAGSKVVADASSLSTQLLHIPEATLQQLKATASLHCREGQYVSSNDTVSSLLWLLMCYLRKRPLPGQARPPALQDACLGLAFDLRTASAAATRPPGGYMTAGCPASAAAGITSSSSKPTAGPAGSSSSSSSGAPGAAWVDLAHLKDLTPPNQDTATLLQPTAAASPASAAAGTDRQQTLDSNVAAGPALDHSQLQLPPDYFGSAAWSIHVRSCTELGESAEDPSWALPVAWHSSLNSVEWQLMCSDAGLLARSLAAGAVRIRGALQAVRSDAQFPARMLQQVQQCCEAGAASQLAMTAGLVHRLDAFVTSWQFGIFDVAFGSSRSSRTGGQPLAFQGLVHPVPPYHAVVLPAPPAAATAAAAAAAGAAGGAEHDAAVAAAAAASGGVWCCLTVPQCLVGLMVGSPVLQLLAPGARCLSPGAV
uniref:Uncharacterized protein n=1 Tax=Tetradesmus obliquus TaxID=3088 RepID=A0A383V810_TETOB|eukprot:jgi/Sobl393_1/6837/SZX60476.1